MPPKLQLRSRVQGTADREGAAVVPADCVCLLTGDADVYKPDGTLLAALRRKVIAPEIIDAARPSLLYAAKQYSTDNRGKYAGLPRGLAVGPNGKATNSHTIDPITKKVARVDSAIVGYFGKQGGRFPFCRTTKFTAEEVEKWNTIVPLAHAVGKLMEQAVPARYKAQMEIVERTCKEYVITDTPFTTLTINHNIAGRIHQDAGDYKPGFGVISVCRRGYYTGGWLVFPEYQVGADLQDGDVIFFDPHEWHGVTDFANQSDDYERISIVYYYRSHMIDCLPQAEEMERARNKYGQIEADE